MSNNLAAPRALTPPERAKLRARLKVQLNITSDDDADDAEDLLDYVFDMVEGGKTAGHIAEELLFMEMPVCGEAEAKKVGEALATFFASLENGGGGEDDADRRALQERLAGLRKKKSDRLAVVQQTSDRLAVAQKSERVASVHALVAGLEKGKGKETKGGGAAGVPKAKKGEQSPVAGLKKEKTAKADRSVAGLEKGKDDEEEVFGEEEKAENEDLPSPSSMTVAELKEELRARNNSGYVPNSRLALEAALGAARKKDGADEAPQETAKKEKEDLPSPSSMTVAELTEELRARNGSGSYVPHGWAALVAALAAARKKEGGDETPTETVKESCGGQEEEEEAKEEEGDIKEAVPAAVGIEQPSAPFEEGNKKTGAKEAHLNKGRQVKAWVTKPSTDCFLGIGLTGNDGTVRITSIAQDGLFARTDLEVGQVLETINGERCQTATEAVARLYAAKGIIIVAYEVQGDIEQGATTGTSAAGGSASRDDEVLADVASGGSRLHPATNRDTKDNDGKGMGVAIFCLLFLSVILNFIPSSVAVYIGGICIVTALVLTSTILCKCCCAADYKLEGRDEKFLNVTLLCLVVMFVLGIIGAFMLSSNGMVITSGILVLSGISFLLIVIAMIFTGLFVWGGDCWSDQRLKRRAITLSWLAFALGLAVVIGVSVPQVQQARRDLCYSGVDDPLQIGNGMCQLEYNTEECWFDGGDCLHYNELKARYPSCGESWWGTANWLRLGDGVCDYKLNSEECGYDAGDCAQDEYPDCRTNWQYLVGNGHCDLNRPGLNSEECGWDGGDCIVEGYPDCHVNNPTLIGNGVCMAHGGQPPYNSEECGFDGGDCIEFNANYPDCPVGPSKLGDGKCDDDANTEACKWDGGDCTEFNKYPDCDLSAVQNANAALIGNGHCDGWPYIIKDCGYDGGDCILEDYPDCIQCGGGSISSGGCDLEGDWGDSRWIPGSVNALGNGHCDKALNRAACGYDGGDCLIEGYPDCHVSAHVIPLLGDGHCILRGDRLSSESTEALNTEECGFDGGDCIVEGYPNCKVPFPSRVGDGNCDSQNNTPECGFDGGDCKPHSWNSLATSYNPEQCNYWISLLVSSDVDSSGGVSETEYHFFLSSIDDPPITTYFDGYGDLNELPWIFRVVHKSLSCQCENLGFGAECCEGDNPEILLLGLEDRGLGNTPAEEEYQDLICQQIFSALSRSIP